MTLNLVKVKMVFAADVHDIELFEYQTWNGQLEY